MADPSGIPGGTAHGLNAYADTTDADTVPSLDRAMIATAEWITSSAGTFLGHVKMAVSAGSRTMTLNLTDLGTGVEHHGSLEDGVRADIRFMAAVLDVDHGELAEVMKEALASNGFKVKDKNINLVELR
ncbi:MAG: hypothetical protein FWH44_04715 [Methanomassiliicoccaceae archaeon]|nr:hypothetical protein [Methanomassiliicoccaceae archaeon]